jgi:uncharacterized protein (TIGR03067 family)
MKTITIAGVAFLTLTATLAADYKADKALKELHGTYTAVALKKDGAEVPEKIVGRFTAKFFDDEVSFTVQLMEKGEEKTNMHPAKIKVDATQMPATIDIAPLDGPEKGKTFLGIYKFEKGELVLVFTEKGDRPEDFTGEGEVLFVRLKRDDKK